MKILVTLLSICFCLSAIILISCDSKDSANVLPQTGVGGSMAKFAITGNTLYIVSKRSLDVYNIEDGGNPKKGVTRDMSVGIETIFPYQNHLFIGAQDGMYIYNNDVPNSPRLLTKFTHVQSCDPVVVQGDYAYVTLRGGVPCRGAGLNTLDVVDISNPSQPELVKSVTMKSPYGLGVSGNKLFVCEGDNGFRVMDISHPKEPTEIHYWENVPSYDVIAKDNNLIITGKGGLLQYRYGEGDELDFLSKIPVL